MFAFILLKLGHLFGMASETGIGHIFSNGDNQRCMRVVVTSEATLQFIVWLAGMAVAAFRNIFGAARSVSFVAVQAGDGGFVFLAVQGDVSGFLIVAFEAIVLA